MIPNEPKIDLQHWVWSPQKQMFIGREAEPENRAARVFAMRGDGGSFSLHGEEVRILRDRGIECVLILCPNNAYEYELSDFEDGSVSVSDANYRWIDISDEMFDGNFWERKV